MDELEACLHLCLVMFVFDTTTLLFIMLCHDYERSYGVCTY